MGRYLGSVHKVQGTLGLRISGFWCRGLGSEFRVQGARFEVWGLGLGALGLGFRVSGIGFRVLGFKFGIRSLGLEA